jgi:hypothetical protein
MQVPRQPQPLFALPGFRSMLFRPGNIDLLSRPIVRNPGGSISTVRSVTFTGDKGRAVLLPTVIGNRVVSPQQALAHYQKTGENLGWFHNSGLAEKYAQALHRQQARLYGG